MSQDYNTKQIVVRSYLPKISLKFRNDDDGYISDKIFPVIGGLNKEAKIYKHARAAWFRSVAQARSPGGSAAIAETFANLVNLDPKNWAIAQKIPDELIKQASAEGNFKLKPFEDAAEFIGDQLRIRKEKSFSETLHATQWNGLAAGGEDAEGHWGDTTASADTMLTDIKKGETAILSKTGKTPNTLMLNWPAWSQISQSPYWLDKLQNTAFTPMTTSLLSGFLDLNVVISKAIEDLTAESTDRDTITSSWITGPVGADNAKGTAFLCNVPSNPGLNTLAAGYQYRIRKSGNLDIAMSRWREDRMHSDMLDGEIEFDMAAVCDDCGYLWKNTALT